MMQRLKGYVQIWVMACLLAGCSVLDDSLPTEPVMVDLHLAVATAEMAGSASTRADTDYQLPECIGEQIQTVRIVIVRPTGEVECNRYLNMTQATMQTDYYRFRVVANETKTVYLFVNENAQRQNYDGQQVKIVNYNFGTIAEGETFPEAVEKLEVSLSEAYEQLKSGTGKQDVLLPMNERHSVTVTDQEQQKLLFVTRAATKFTYIVTNRSDRPCTLSGIAIDKMARREYYLPQSKISYSYVAVPSGSTDPDAPYNTLGQMDLTNYSVPMVGTNEYYTFTQSVDRTIAAGATVTIDPIYLLEGKFNSYQTTLTINGVEVTAAFPNLGQLPRNTHVVVKAMIDERNHTWEVDLFPYIQSDILAPDFGL
ncbi:MAG: hypothetical protein IJ494_05595 [Bacteroides sp.]|nr:hypothetical protein [Bacteroides sp.]